MKNKIRVRSLFQDNSYKSHFILPSVWRPMANNEKKKTNQQLWKALSQDEKYSMNWLIQDLLKMINKQF